MTSPRHRRPVQGAPLRLVSSVTELARAPIGRAVMGRSFVAWCATARLVGTVHFGRRDAGDAKALLALYDLATNPSLRPPLHRVVDGRALEGVDDDAWQAMTEAMAPRIQSLRGLFARQAVLVSQGVRGARTTALLAALGPGDAYRAFEDAEAAFAWADPDDGPTVRFAVDALVESIRGDATVERARAWARAHFRSPSVDSCARALGVSTRTLQRKLTEAATSFREVVLTERVREAVGLLRTSNAKVSAIAATVGCTSAAHLGVLLRRAGEGTPSQLRAR